MAYRRKYRRGEPIRSLDDLAQQDFIYFGTSGRLIAKGWFMSWQMRYAAQCISAGWLFRAEKNEEARDEAQ